MRLPELAGYRLEKLMGEDPYGWSFLAGKARGDKRMVRILKSQATQDQSIGGIYRHITALQQSNGVATVDRYSPRMVGMPSAISSQFPGWKGKSGQWMLSSVAYLSRVMEKDGALSSGANILHTLGDLHRQGIHHGGLRPENIFLTNGQGDEPEVKVTGFGEMVAPGIQHLEASNLPFYLAPEQLQQNVPTPEKIAQWDVYSAGVIVYYLLSKHLPRLDRLCRQYWTNPEQMDTLVLISQGKLTRNAGQIYLLLENEKDLVWPDQHNGDEEKILRAIVEKCLAFDPAERFRNLAEVSDSLKSANRLLAEKQAKEAAAATQAATDVAAAKAAAATTVASPRPATAPIAESTPALASAHLSVASSTDKVSINAQKKDSQPKSDDGSLDDLFDSGAKKKDVDPDSERWLPVLGDIGSSSLLGKGIAALLMIGVGALGWMSWNYKSKLDATEQQRLKAVAALQENLRQANSYQHKIAKTQESAQNLAKNFNAAAEKNEQLLSESRMARGLLKETQANGDRFFKLILENKDTDVPEFRENRRLAMHDARKHYQQLIEIYQDAPANFADSTAHAHYYLGRIHKELGDIESSARSFASAERIYEALMQSERNAEFTENLAVAKRELGELGFRQGAYNHASNFFDDSSRHWQELANLDSSRVLDANIETNLNSLKIVDCLRSVGKIDEALDGAERVASSFMGLRERNPGNERLIGGLARAFEVIGLTFENSNRDKAIDGFNQAGSLYAEAIQLNSTVDLYHLSFANCLARAGLLTNDIDRMKKSIVLMKEVIPRMSTTPESLIAMADVYGALAAHQRNGGKTDNAIAIEEEIIRIMKPLVNTNSPMTPAALSHAYSKRLVHLADLRVDNDKFESSRLPLKDAIEVLARIATEGAPPSYRRTLATARGLAGFASLRSGDKSSAKSHYNLAKEDWMAYISLNPTDTDAANNARWTSEQLKALR